MRNSSPKKHQYLNFFGLVGCAVVLGACSSSSNSGSEEGLCSPQFWAEFARLPDASRPDHLKTAPPFDPMRDTCTVESRYILWDPPIKVAHEVFDQDSSTVVSNLASAIRLGAPIFSIWGDVQFDPRNTSFLLDLISLSKSKNVQPIFDALDARGVQISDLRFSFGVGQWVDPIILASALDTKGIVLQEIIDQGADVNKTLYNAIPNFPYQPPYHGYRPLHAAAKEGNETTVKILMDYGATNEPSEIPLFDTGWIERPSDTASRNGHSDLAQELSGGSISLTDDGGTGAGTPGKLAPGGGVVPSSNVAAVDLSAHPARAGGLGKGPTLPDLPSNVRCERADLLAALERYEGAVPRPPGLGGGETMVYGYRIFAYGVDFLRALQTQCNIDLSAQINQREGFKRDLVRNGQATGVDVTQF